MTNPRSIEERISLWLEEEAVSTLPDRVLDATFDTTRELRQVGSSPWKNFPMLRSFGMLAAAGAAAVVLAVVGFVFLRSLPTQPGVGASPAGDATEPFVGVWISTSDADGGMQTMTVERSADLSVTIVVTDTVASVCDLTPSTMTGDGSVEGNQMIIPTPDYRCDDGSEPQLINGDPTPLNEDLRNLTYVRDPASDILTVNGTEIWTRLGGPAPTDEPIAEGTGAPSLHPSADPSPLASAPGSMWPQTSLDEIRAAQELADAGNPDYAWQLDPRLVGNASPWTSDVLDRFIREGLGWEEYKARDDAMAYDERGGYYTELVFIRCAPGEANPLYPDDPDGATCAPTIDDFRYETVTVTLEQPVRRDPSGIWVVTEWQTLQPAETRSIYDHLHPDFAFRQFIQVAPPAEEEAAAHLQAFLEARLDGEGAEQYLHLHPGEDPISTWERVPMLLYATTGGSPYERSDEIERTQSPEWPSGWFEFRTRLIAADETVVEQLFAVIRQEDGRLGLVYGYPATDEFPTTENGQAVPIPYTFLDGAVTFGASPAWSGAGNELSSGEGPTFAQYLGNPGLDERFEMVAGPHPVGADCEPGAAPADAEALAQSVLSDPDLEATDPVAVNVGGVDALQMDVAATPGASVCGNGFGGPQVLTDGADDDWMPAQLGDEDGRMRLYLLDLPGESAEVLAIVIAAPASEFERVLEAATPIVNSIEFHAR